MKNHEEHRKRHAENRHGETPTIVEDVLQCEFHTISIVSYLTCSHICQEGSTANNAVVPSADSGLEK